MCSMLSTAYNEAPPDRVLLLYFPMTAILTMQTAFKTINVDDLLPYIQEVGL